MDSPSSWAAESNVTGDLGPVGTSRSITPDSTDALALQQCAACNALQHPPEEICHVCGSFRFLTRTVAPTGTVYSYTILSWGALTQRGKEAERRRRAEAAARMEMSDSRPHTGA
ncbi:MAG: zinc ribbon domain-containing protein [Mycetocola sp.]